MGRRQLPKGLAVVSYGDYRLTVHEAYDPSLRWILPLKVDGPLSFVLFAVWTVPHPETRYYVQCLFEAVETYRDVLKLPRVVWAGDFNNNIVFDRPRDDLKFAHWLAKVRTLGFTSLYHLQNRCKHGAEPDDTFFLYHDARKGHHLDFIFAKPALYRTGVTVSVGNPRTWLKRSDHMPIACLFRGRDQRGD
jgi:exodeoxyribonuclease III